jgi:hypothetical protein
MCGDMKFCGRVALSRTHILVAAAGPVAIVIDLVVGLWIAADFRLRVAFGEAYSNTGVVLILCAIAQLPLCACGFYGAKSHNKCLLIAHAIYIGVIGVIATISTLIVLLHPEPSQGRTEEWRVACATAKTAGEEGCVAFYNEPQSQRLADLWTTMHQMSVRGVLSRMELDKVASDGACCGFSPPTSCRTDRYVEPSNEYAGCSTTSGFTHYYPWTDTCDEAVNAGGCPYDQPSGPCVTVAPTMYSTGCIVALHKYLLLCTRPLGYVAVVACIFQFVMLAVALCYCLKHKKNHALPPRGWTVSEDGRGVFIEGFWVPPPTTIKIDLSDESFLPDSDEHEEMLKAIRDGKDGDGAAPELKEGEIAKPTGTHENKQ